MKNAKPRAFETNRRASGRRRLRTLHSDDGPGLGGDVEHPDFRPV